MGVGEVLGGIGAVGSMFGAGEDSGSPAGSTNQSASGYNAMPPEAQRLYQLYFDMLRNYQGNPNDPSRFAKAQMPNAQNPYASQALYEYQNANPDKNVRPLGVVEPLNAIQQRAIGKYEKPDYSMGGLAEYFNPYMENVINRSLGNINRQANISRSGIMDQANRSGGILGTSALGTQLSQNEEARLRAIGDTSANLGAQGFREALGLRQQSLSDMLNAGNLVQKQNQSLLQAALPQNFAGYNPAYQQAMAFANLLQGIPNSSTSSGSSTAGTPAGLNTLGKGLNGLNSLFGNQFTGMFG
jgi:hypothetical protein